MLYRFPLAAKGRPGSAPDNRNMASIPLTRRSLAHYWRTNLAVVAGVAVAVAVLTGSLLVGDSVRGSLKRLALQRLGAAHWVLTSTVYFREALAGEMAAHPGFSRSFGAVCPILVQEGWLTQPRTGRRAGGVSVYGVDERFWRFQGVELDRAFGSDFRSGRQVLLSPEAARDLMAEAGSSVLLRLEEPSNVPRDSLHGRRDRVGRTLRLSVSGILQPSRMGEFSLSPRQGPVRAAFVPLRRLQRDLGVPNRINTLLVSRAGASRQQTSDPAQTGELAGILRDVYSLEDTDLKLRVLDRQQCLSVETEGTLIGEGLAARVQEAADTLGLRTSLLFTYLANSIRSGGRQIPYSLVTALDFPSFGLPPASPGGEMPPLVLNRWAARDLEARPGDLLELDYYLWAEQGRLLTRSAKFRLSGVVPMEGPLADRDLAPAYPGITESRTLVDWDPPFPMELGRIRPRDESYWEEYRTTPKAFVPLQVGQELWRSRHGQLSSIRVYPTARGPGRCPRDTPRPSLPPGIRAQAHHRPRPIRLLAARGRRSSRAGPPGGSPTSGSISSTSASSWWSLLSCSPAFFSSWVWSSGSRRLDCFEPWASILPESAGCSSRRESCWRGWARWWAWREPWATPPSSCWDCAPGGWRPWAPPCWGFTSRPFP